jgi:hypothetical protein
MCISLLKLKTDRNNVLSTSIALQHRFMLKYQVDNDKYVKFLTLIHQQKLVNIGLPV